MRQSLHGVVDLLTGSAPRDLPEQDALAAWQALFFVVPVVSTTFASFARMFSHLGRESIGWVLIDEGGQATPQSAVGALWRARHGVVVGDPLQLEPITSLSSRVEGALARAHGVDPDWSPQTLSAQRLADRATPLGTWIGTAEARVWVGAPLTVHRRCDQPMFDLVNELVYDRLMVHATGAGGRVAFDEAHGRLPASKWIDVPPDGARGHWVPAEGERLDRILETLHARGVDMADVMVIAPFRDVERELRPRRRRYPDLAAGTIHTAQGREADVVVLILGGDPRKPGAKAWAAEKPNLLNVAASRARRRLYLIGDRGAWAEQRYFDVLARYLPDGEAAPPPA
ncbi:MAG TPA: DEAD/DEAH box helicase [Solirubrobacteraceae bacterium]|nr:DEAD/DEAH box helicase [Solirubrobacteraceae bacterium]